jgi:hypothetical protein
LIAVGILEAGPTSLNRDRGWFSASYCQKRKYHILILMLHDTSRDSFQNQGVVTKYKATEKVQYLHQFNIFSVS